MHVRDNMRHQHFFAAASVAAAFGAAASPAAAANYLCEASAVRASILGQQAIEPISANRGATECRAQRAGGASVLPAPLATTALGAETVLSGPADTPGAQTAAASGGIADVRVRLLPELPIELPSEEIVENLQPVTVPLGGVPLPGVPSQISVDLRPAVRALLAGLPNADLIRVRAAIANAQARCVDGQVRLEGASQVAGVSVLGQELLLNGLVEQALEVIGAQKIDPSKLDVSKIGLPEGIAPELLPAVQAAIQPVLDALPDIEIPPTIAQIGIRPGTQERTATRLTQRALTVSVSIAGQRLLDAVVGEATVGHRDVVCPTGAVNVAQAALECTTRRLVLIDVVERGGRVRLTGAADRRYVGQRVRIFFAQDGRSVASAVVQPDGTFRTTAALPARRLRGTNLARYEARIGSERSLRLKLRRRMEVRSVRVNGDRVRITGRVIRPLARPVREIEVRRRISCRRTAVVARVKPNARGEFTVTVSAPPSELAAVYRFATRVRKNRRNPKTFPTFTLPRYVDLS